MLRRGMLFSSLAVNICRNLYIIQFGIWKCMGLFFFCGAIALIWFMSAQWVFICFSSRIIMKKKLIITEKIDNNIVSIYFPAFLISNSIPINDYKLKRLQNVQLYAIFFKFLKVCKSAYWEVFCLDISSNVLTFKELHGVWVISVLRAPFYLVLLKFTTQWEFRYVNVN